MIELPMYPMTDEETVVWVESTYDEWYDNLDVIPDDSVLDEVDDWRVKRAILSYGHPDTFTNDIIHATTEREYRVQKKIQDALDVLEQYDTRAYYILRNNGYYNPFVSEPNPEHKTSTPAAAAQEYDKNFIASIVGYGIPAYKAKRILTNLKAL